ncbi:MAG: hypothetical protein QNJ81_06465 [Acidimicrobiia bacterium]|nr:hypothetical protein [Acidimicrobiia bacterium]
MKLDTVMVRDAWATGTSTVLTIAAAPLLGGWLGVSGWIVAAVGLALVPWTVFLAMTARQDPLIKWRTAVIAAGNLAWVVAAAVLVIGYPGAMSTTGRWLLGLFSLVVLGFGLLQTIGLLRWGDPGA